MSALPRSHIENGGIDITASSCSSLTRADMSYRWNASTYWSMSAESGAPEGGESADTAAIVARARCRALLIAGTDMASALRPGMKMMSYFGSGEGTARTCS